jgi:hypothetical protein
MEEVAKCRNPNEQNLQVESVMRRVADKFGVRGAANEQPLLTIFFDLFRAGYLAWGYDITNARPPFFHATVLGRKALENFGRDPANPDGYMAYLRSVGALSPVVESYVQEALTCFSSSCFKAAAVMIGVASEVTALDLRDALAKRLPSSGSKEKGLNDWKIKTVLDAMRRVLERNKNNMDQALRNLSDAHWPSFMFQIRAARNDAGHAGDIATLTEDAVHGNLLIFPSLFSLATKLQAWLSSNPTLT